MAEEGGKLPSRGEEEAPAPELRELLPCSWLIASERMRQGMSQADLADRARRLAAAEGSSCGMTRQSINRYEHGPIAPKPDTRRWLALALGLPVAQVSTAAEAQRDRRRGRGPGAGSPPELPTLLADAGMDIPWSSSGTLAVIEDWLVAGLVDRRTFLAVSGAALGAIGSTYLRLRSQRSLTLIGEGSHDELLIRQIEQGIQLVRDLDDTEGGAGHLAYADAQFKALGVLLRNGGNGDAVNRRIVSALAELAHQVGWMAYDAAQHGLAQRYYLTGLRAAHDAGDDAIASHILADLAHMAASRGDVADGVRLGEAARETSARASAGVRASVLTRVAYVDAAAGLMDQFEQSWIAAREALERRHEGGEPNWMYYMTPGHVDAQAGYSLVLAGRGQREGGDPKTGRRLLERGQALLREWGSQDRDLTHPHQRRALFEGCWLAVGLGAAGDSTGACEVARLAVQRLERVRSPRSAALLQMLVTDLRGRKREPVVREFLPELRQAIIRHAVAG